MHISGRFIISSVAIFSFVVIQFNTAGGNPVEQPARLKAFKRARSLDNGISISWYEQTWNKDILNKKPLKTADFKLLKQLGLKV